jgi:predicted  nucleic acid-binding Zn-ribbon protein
VAQGIQSELATLAKRKGELEDASLGFMEGVAEAEGAVAQAKLQRAEVDQKVAAAQQGLAAEAAKLASGIELSAADRKQLAERLPHELLELYINKAKRGVPVGRLSHRECGACHMSITASALQELQNAAADDLVTCPECSAILVR